MENLHYIKFSFSACGVLAQSFSFFYSASIMFFLISFFPFPVCFHRQELINPGFVKCNELFSAVCYKHLAFPSCLSAKPTGIPFMFCKREQRYIFFSWYLSSHIA